ncbi:hypothetical protein EMCG_02562 [[Emmonsia] crescens]|uniref:ML-like domain-containing protein n=1 Tax=[Emmonsia] crescens TaxID=73230 RepID=A0A0G2J8Y9_9EURO|nr:hypothetical protein EMCG_02562 [Emmonsia crescens UAMH 3008]
MNINTIALAGLLFISTTAAADAPGANLCVGAAACSDSSPGYNHTIHNPIAKGSITFKGFNLGNTTSNATPANWTWDLSVGNYSSGGDKVQIYEVYSLRIPLEVELSGPNVYHNVCAIALPAKEGAGMNDPGDCSTIFKAEDISEVLAVGATSSFSQNRSPCARLTQSVYEALGYEPGSGGSLSSATLFGRGGNETRIAEIETGLVRAYHEISVEENLPAIDASLMRVQPIYLQAYSAVEGFDAEGQTRLSCVHVERSGSVRGVVVGMGSVLALAVVAVGLLMV